MPTYEFRCRSCSETFKVQRPMDRSGEPADCPHGHTDTVRLLTTAGMFSKQNPSASGGGCCGGACCAN
ncbi:MAG TPA: zinc ribbon domain-containing protein [Actinomycetota bacterium]|nr:zinc ribbon domain-containing protein [Actinomycetota bacterium]